MTPMTTMHPEKGHNEPCLISSSSHCYQSLPEASLLQIPSFCSDDGVGADDKKTHFALSPLQNYAEHTPSPMKDELGRKMRVRPRPREDGADDVPVFLPADRTEKADAVIKNLSSRMRSQVLLSSSAPITTSEFFLLAPQDLGKPLPSQHDTVAGASRRLLRKSPIFPRLSSSFDERQLPLVTSALNSSGRRRSRREMSASPTFLPSSPVFSGTPSPHGKSAFSSPSHAMFDMDSDTNDDAPHDEDDEELTRLYDSDHSSRSVATFPPNRRIRRQDGPRKSQSYFIPVALQDMEDGDLIEPTSIADHRPLMGKPVVAVRPRHAHNTPHAARNHDVNPSIKRARSS